MKKFNLKQAQEDLSENTPLASGYHESVIIQVAEVGLQPGFNPGDPPRQMLGLTFELAEGRQLAKTGALSVNLKSMLGQVLSVADRDADNLDDLLGARLVLEVEENGRYPRLAGYHPVDDGLVTATGFTPKGPLLYFNVESHDPEILKQLHRDLRQAVSSRLRVKGGRTGDE